MRLGRFGLAPFALALAISPGFGCGGGAPQPKAEAATPVDPSIGDIAVANGGIAELGAPSGATYAAGGLRADLVDKAQPIKLDGVVDEWPARTLASTVIKGSGDRISFAVALQYDATNVYVGGEVKDPSFVRTAHFADGEDHASLTIAFPHGGAYEIGLFAGKPGESEGLVRFVGARRTPVAGAKIVEAPAEKGYTFEAQIPWSTFPEAHSLRVGLRGVARYYDAEAAGSRSPRSIVATGQGDPSTPGDLPALLTEPEESMLEGVLTQKGLTKTAPRIDVYADITGDGMKERISVYDKTVTICGPGYRGGKEYFYRDAGAEIVRLEARELTGRGKADLLVRRRFEGDDKASKREWFEVWSMLGKDEPVTTFAHEIVVARDGKHVDNAVHAHGSEIEVTYEPATGWDQASYREPTASDVEPILLPWGTVRSQSFHFDGREYKKVHEVAQAGTAPARTASVGQGTAAPALPTDLPTPVIRPGGDLSRQVLDQYRHDQHVGASVLPRFDLQVNVDGDGRPERVVLLGRDLVVFGPGFLGGTQYAFLTLSQFEAGADVHEVVARDMTGDGSAELVVRGVRRAAGGLEVDAMFVYQVKGGSIARVFAIETGREQGRRRVQGMVQLVPAKDGHGFDVDVRPGRAVGWTKRTYPWAQDAPGAGPIEPLLLPWGGIAALRYSWNGTAFVRP